MKKHYVVPRLEAIKLESESDTCQVITGSRTNGANPWNAD